MMAAEADDDSVYLHVRLSELSEELRREGAELATVRGLTGSQALVSPSVSLG